MQQSSVNVDYRLLAYRSVGIVCSRCLRAGIKTPVIQIISARHRLLSLCHACRESDRTLTSR